MSIHEKNQTIQEWYDSIKTNAIRLAGDTYMEDGHVDPSFLLGVTHISVTYTLQHLNLTNNQLTILKQLTESNNRTE